MTSGQKKMAWILGLAAGVIGVGTVAYVLTKPKTTSSGTLPTGDGGSGPKVIPSGPSSSTVYAPPSSKSNPYGASQQGGQPSFGSYLAQNSTQIDPNTGNA